MCELVSFLSRSAPDRTVESEGTRDGSARTLWLQSATEGLGASRQVITTAARYRLRFETQVGLVDERGRVAEVIARYVVRAAEGRPLGETLCATCVEVLELPGAAIMLLATGGTHSTLGASDQVMAEIEELQRTLGEGPCLDAYRHNAPVLVPDLAAAGAAWIGFVPAALEAGAGALFGFPLHVGAGPIGALNLYASEAGQLSVDQHRDALVLADLVTYAVLAIQGGAKDLVGELADIGAHQTQINQATGMVTAQLNLSVADALGRIRAHAYATSRSVSEVAADITSRRLRLEP